MKNLLKPMDCILQQSCLPHIFINSNSSNLAPIHPHKIRNRPWKFAAVGLSGFNNISDDDDDDDSSFKKQNSNGSLFDQLTSPAPFTTVEAEITQETIDFFVSDAQGDPDSPSSGFSSVEQAITALRQEKVGQKLVSTKFT